MSKRGAKSGQISSKKSKHFHRKAIHQAVAAACLSLATNLAFAVCPAPVASIISIPDATTSADTCFLNAGESLVIDNAGLLESAVTAFNANAGSIANNGSISGGFRGIVLRSGSSIGNLTNNGNISGLFDGVSLNSGSSITNLTNKIGRAHV